MHKETAHTAMARLAVLAAAFVLSVSLAACPGKSDSAGSSEAESDTTEELIGKEGDPKGPETVNETIYLPSKVTTVRVDDYPDGWVTYDDDGNEVPMEDSTTTTVMTYEYDTYGRVTSSDSDHSGQEAFAPDPSAVDADDSYYFEYDQGEADANGNVVSERATNSVTGDVFVFTYEYNENGDRTKMTRTHEGTDEEPQVTTYAYTYDASGNPTSITSKDQGTGTTAQEEYAYDSNGRRVSTKHSASDGYSSTMTYEFYDNGAIKHSIQTIESVDPETNETSTYESSTEYSENGYVTEMTSTGLGSTTTSMYAWEYDDKGNPTSCTVTSTNEYDGQVVENEMTYTYTVDENGCIATAHSENVIEDGYSVVEDVTIEYARIDTPLKDVYESHLNHYVLPV